MVPNQGKIQEPRITELNFKPYILMKEMQMSCLLVENKVDKPTNVNNNLYLILKLTFVIKMP